MRRERGLIERWQWRFALAVAAACVWGCPGAKSSVEAGADMGWARGRVTYMANCIACHHADPSQDGALGPAVKGSSLELITARVMRAEYPAGYTPKRPSKTMAALPHLEKQLADLAAFLK